MVFVAKPGCKTLSASCKIVISHWLRVTSIFLFVSSSHCLSVALLAATQGTKGTKPLSLFVSYSAFQLPFPLLLFPALSSLLFALCPLLSALCPLLFTPFSLPCALCPVLYALCPLPFALCPLPSALITSSASLSSFFMISAFSSLAACSEGSTTPPYLKSE
jgi:hypothetical protein